MMIENTKGNPMKKNTKNKIFFILLFLIGLSIMAYPFLSEYIKNKNQTDIISQYEENVENLSETDISTLKEEAKAYNNRLSGDTDDSDISIENKSYVDFLNVGDVIRYIEIPKIDVNLPIYHGTDDAVLQKGVGHLETSSLPVGGKSTHAVLTGHRGLPTSTLFTHLDEVEEGDIFYIKVLDETLAYKVNQIKVVLPEETNDLQIVKDKDYVTLVTCTPYMINSHRLLVRGERIDVDNSTDETTSSKEITNNSISIRENTNQYIIIYVCAFCIFVTTIYILWYILNISNRKNKKDKCNKHKKTNRTKPKPQKNVKISIDENNSIEEII